MNRRKFIEGLIASGVTVSMAPNVIEQTINSLTDVEFNAISTLPYEDAFSKMVATTFKSYREQLVDNLTRTPSLYTYLKSKEIVE